MLQPVTTLISKELPSASPFAVGGVVVARGQKRAYPLFFAFFDRFFS